MFKKPIGGEEIIIIIFNENPSIKVQAQCPQVHGTDLWQMLNNARAQFDVPWIFTHANALLVMVDLKLLCEFRKDIVIKSVDREDIPIFLKQTKLNKAIRNKSWSQSDDWKQRWGNQHVFHRFSFNNLWHLPTRRYYVSWSAHVMNYGSLSVL